MNIIFISNHMSQAKTLSVWQVALIVLALVFIPVLLTLLFIVPQEASAQKAGKSLIPAPLRFSFNYRQKHLDAYALQLGEMQARIMRLDAQTERLTQLANEKSASGQQATLPVEQKSTTNKTKHDGKGGPLVFNAPTIITASLPMTETGLQNSIAELNTRVEFDTDYLGRVEAKILQQSVLKDMLPNSSPVTVAYRSSSYGWRSDPFTSENAFHEGLDFPGPVGTPIYAAADGIVSTAEDSMGYGKLVKIEHGSGLETRYGHNSRLIVKAGERVTKGQLIAEMGSTGRSTGPHLHYEIRLNGNALDPRQYLNDGA
jgi:murein DD-endopeptidase MepM/ murein hydrolase activator NlpD